MTRTNEGAWPDSHTEVVGVIGDPVRHSLSPLLYNTAFRLLVLDWVCLAFPVAAGQAAVALDGARALGLRGLSVTMPHKSEVRHLVDECSDLAVTLDAVNSVVRVGDRLRGENTDGEGFLAALARGAAFEPAGKRCMILGAGGAARAMVVALARGGAGEVVVVNRTAERAHAAASLAGRIGRAGSAADVAEMDLVANAIPAGMGGHGDIAPLVEGSHLHPGQIAFDAVYHPAVTPWLADSAGAGAIPVGGLGMLVHQAASQFTGWTGEAAPVEAMWAAAEERVGQLTPEE